MVGKVSAENAFGQILICLRMSKLNFILKETPYSGYVTIRKKFVKEVENGENGVIDSENVDIDSETIESVNIVNDMKKKFEDVSRQYGMLEFAKEELEVKFETLEKEKVATDDHIEEVYAKNRELMKINEELLNENCDLKDAIDKAKTEAEKNSKAFKRSKILEESIIDLEGKIMMHENAIESRDLEIVKLKKAILCEQNNANIDIPKKDVDAETEYFNSVTRTVNSFLASTSSVKEGFECDECGLVIKTTEDLKIHMEKDHVVKCEHCDENFAGISKLQKHMCRIHVNNPNIFDLYMKNWFVRNECFRVFSEHKSKEIAIIHSEVCVKSHSCSWVLPTFISQLRYIDNTDLIHLHTSEFLLNGNVQWDILTKLIESQNC